MRVTMNVQISGVRNGKPWPAKGETIDLPDGEAAQLCAAGMAETVKDKVEKAVPKKAETTKVPESEAAQPSAPEKRGPGRPKGSTNKKATSR